MQISRSTVAGLMFVAIVLAADGARGQDSHWAFVAPRAVEPPSVVDRSWPLNPIDRFILAGLEEFNLRPAPPATKATLLRRVHFDLTGLPPTVAELRAFLADDQPGAYERVVDRLLASPEYGERWAQHWLDVARYADTDGYEFDAVRPEAWRYRDWVVHALNGDMPYQEFVQWQLAGDEIAPGSDTAFIATGFNRCYPDMVDQNDQNARRQSALNDMTETAGLTFLGLTLGCARCHDHKTDPIPQADFYRLQAFFAPARFRDDRAVDDAADQRRFEARLAAWQSRLNSLRQQLQRAAPAEREGLRRQLDRLTKLEKPVPPQARGLDETGDTPAKTFVLLRGDIAARGAEVSPGFPSALSTEAPEITAMPHSSGRRRALAQWLTQPDHPLTARVVVNRLWQHHFGRGIVATPSDFGLLGEAPSHPELLDMLALELVRQEWRLKPIQRLIVTSAAYRQSAEFNAKAAEFDPDNTLVWRHSRRRLDGEAIRDALLAVGGELNSRMGGPGVFPELPRELAKLNAQGVAWPVSKNREDQVRRSLYVFVRRNMRYPFFEAFDRPDTNASCPQRARTTTAPQALSMLNSSLVQSAAMAAARRIEGGASDRDTRIQLAYESILGRPATSEEAQRAGKFVDAGHGYVDLCLALFNVNAFLYVD